MGDKYKALADCRNCLRESEHDVPKGIRIVDYLEKQECPFCGCTTLSKSTVQPGAE
jgi:transcription elongation factor Elf1